MSRFLLFTSKDAPILTNLISYGAKDIIVRNLSYCSEYDFQADIDFDTANFYPDANGVFCAVELIDDRRSVSEDPGKPDTKNIIFQANQLISEERFWETHGVLEGAWHESQGRMREYFHGLTLLAVACVQYQTGRCENAKNTYTRALTKISVLPDPQILRTLPVEFHYPLKFVIPELL